MEGDPKYIRKIVEKAHLGIVTKKDFGKYLDYVKGVMV